MYCLRCGEKAEEGRSFCKKCAERVQKPLEDSPYLPTKITLPNRRANPVPKRTEPKKERKKRPWAWILSALFLGILSFSLLMQGGWYFGAWLKTQAALQQTEKERAALQEELAVLQEKLAETRQSNTELQKAFDELETELVRNQISLVDLQQKLQNISRFIVFLEDEEATVFHRQGCVRWNTDDFLAMIRDEAVQKGYTPCELCLP